MDEEEEELFPSRQAMVKPDIVYNKSFSVCVCAFFIQLLNVVDDLIVSAHRERKLYVFVSRSRNDDNYIRFLSFFFSSREKKKKKKKKIECSKLFHWCMLRVGRTVCCNQQTNIIISRMHIVHEK